MPLTALVLYTFGAATILGFSNIDVSFLSRLMRIIIDIMYKTALKIESLPLSVIDVSTNKFTLLCAYSIAIIITASIVYSYRKTRLQGRSYE